MKTMGFLPLALLMLAGTVSSTNTSWTSGRFLDDDGQLVHLSWTVEDDVITMEVTAQTRGYVGLGLSHKGGMKGADIILGWVENGKAHLEDRFSNDYEEPVVDDPDNPAGHLELLGGSENDTHTVITFRRKLNTCDQNDFVITDDTVRVLYAFHPEDPVNGRIKYHKSNRGVQSIVFNNAAGFEATWKEEDVISWNIINAGTDVPTDTDTRYWATIHKAPNLTSKHHIIAWKPIISKEALPYVHHMVLFACSPNNETELEELIGVGFETFIKTTPEVASQCVTFLLAHAIGSQGLAMNEELGYPIGDGAPNTKYFMLEMHYDNRFFHKNVPKNDKSGIEVILTPKLRKHDGWTMLVSAEFGEMLIPPRQPEFRIVGHCCSKCLKDNIPEDGITITSAILHTHTAGKTVTFRHIRNGMELKPLFDDQYYDFNFQLFRKLKDPVKILPGDHLITECIYDTSDRPNVTWGGLTSVQEMCDVVFEYYPKVDLSQCKSSPLISDLEVFFGFKFSGNPRPLSEPVEYSSIVENYKFNKTNTEELQLLVNGRRYQAYCTKTDRNEKPDSESCSYPEIKSTYRKDAIECNLTK